MSDECRWVSTKVDSIVMGRRYDCICELSC